MAIIAELSSAIQILIAAKPAQRASLWAWVSEVHDEQVVEQAGADHWLVQLSFLRPAMPRLPLVPALSRRTAHGHTRQTATPNPQTTRLPQSMH